MISDYHHYVIITIKTSVIIITIMNPIIRITDQTEYACDRVEMSEYGDNYRFNCHYNGIY